MDKKELENFLYYILDKVEGCYKKEIEMSIKYFLNESAPEESIQEQLENIYPTQSTIISKINDGVAVIDENILIDSSQAIKLEIQINDNRYNKNQVYESVKIACQKLLECFR